MYDISKIFGHCPNKVVSPHIVTTSNVVTPTVEKTNDGFQTLGDARIETQFEKASQAICDLVLAKVLEQVGNNDHIRMLPQENANPSPTNSPPVLPTALRARIVQELNELQAILTYINSRLENIDRFLNGFIQQPNEINVDDLEPDDESVDTPLVSHFLYSDDDSDDGEVLKKLEEYGNAGQLCRHREINSFDRDDLAFQCMIGFRKFVAYFDPFLPMNIITRKAYNTIMVKGLESTWKNLVFIVRDVYMFVGIFTYITDFVILEDIGEFILRDMAEVEMGKPFRKITKLEHDYAKGLISFTRIFDNYTFQMPRTIPRFKN
uniref:Zinc knuckle CX2CX4HX4C n=1 Tax=Tanacetum cinerariifolium TaxID=118510 RepID=A0A6L2JJM4_TANCI|nr:zinc knuckle CX2CX4HX4C [Tanacetum cinerariifolium]